MPKSGTACTATETVASGCSRAMKPCWVMCCFCRNKAKALDCGYFQSLPLSQEGYLVFCWVGKILGVGVLRGLGR